MTEILGKIEQLSNDGKPFSGRLQEISDAKLIQQQAARIQALEAALAAALDREQLEVLCSENGAPVPPDEWDKGLEHGLREALDMLRADTRALEVQVSEAEGLVCLAEMLERFNPAEGLSPAGLHHVVLMAEKALYRYRSASGQAPEAGAEG